MMAKQNSLIQTRLAWVQKGILLIIFVILARLAYWQLWMHTTLASESSAQYESRHYLTSQRGQILDKFGKVLVDNQEEFTLFVQPKQLVESPTEISEKLLPILLEQIDSTPTQATDDAWLAEQKNELKSKLLTKLTNPNLRWVALTHRLNRQQKQKIADLNISGLGFDTHYSRFYPDASISAHLLGFVGKTDLGENQGYFGLEGFYDLELRGRQGLVTEQKTALGIPLLLGKQQKLSQNEGSNLITTIDRGLQFGVEEKLKQAMERYGAVSGEVVIMDPQTGAILAAASFPNYDPQSFIDFSPAYYRNPVVSDLYEPGSTLKVITLAAGIEQGVITPETQCDKCAGPRQISGFSIRTWNEVYNPNINMKDALAKSDNTAMVFIQERLGKDNFLQALRNFGFDKKTNIDLQGEADPNFRSDKDWRTIDVATSSFGQGLATTSLHLVRAVAAIANGGKLLQPYVVAKVQQDGEEIVTQPKVLSQVISPETAQIVTEMMVYSASHGDAQWALPEGVTVAGKTGTSQIPGEGGYLEDKTIASFIGFAPAQDPQFVMLVKLREPTSSPWGAETAAPLWFNLLPLVLQASAK